MIWVGGHIDTPLGDGFTANLYAISKGAGSGASVRYLKTPKGFVDRCLDSVYAAAECVGLDLSDKKVVLVLSSTKGENLQLWEPAEAVRRGMNNPNNAVVVSNACTSGVCAQIVAHRLLSARLYEAAVVVGCDIVTDFIRSGFEVLKALSPEPCRPFDAAREGLNLGEAVATMLLANEDWWLAKHPDKRTFWRYEAGSIHNDANHISGPSRTGEGAYRCLCDVLEGVDRHNIALIGLHGTGTLYNDEAEAVALHRAGLSDVPANSLKGFFGHTLGAAGLLETMLCLRALEDGRILPTKGFETQGTTCPLNLDSKEKNVNCQLSIVNYIKLLNGFGGTNAAVRYRRCEL